MMKPIELAQLLNGRQYGNEITRDEMQLARENSLVVVFGYSDDNMEFCGAIDDEVSCYDGGDAHVSATGLLLNKCDCEDCPYFQEQKRSAKKITAVWGRGGYSWIYETQIPHVTFDITEDGEKYCRGIVFSLSDI
jgi:hypothetical protein